MRWIFTTDGTVTNLLFMDSIHKFCLIYVSYTLVKHHQNFLIASKEAEFVDISTHKHTRFGKGFTKQNKCIPLVANDDNAKNTLCALLI